MSRSLRKTKTPSELLKPNWKLGTRGKEKKRCLLSPKGHAMSLIPKRRKRRAMGRNKPPCSAFSKGSRRKPKSERVRSQRVQVASVCPFLKLKLTPRLRDRS